MKKLNPQKKKVELFVLKRDAKYEFHEEEMFK